MVILIAVIIAILVCAVCGVVAGCIIFSRKKQENEDEDDDDEDSMVGGVSMHIDARSGGSIDARSPTADPPAEGAALHSMWPTGVSMEVNSGGAGGDTDTVHGNRNEEGNGNVRVVPRAQSVTEIMATGYHSEMDVANEDKLEDLWVATSNASVDAVSDVTAARMVKAAGGNLSGSGDEVMDEVHDARHRAIRSGSSSSNSSSSSSASLTDAGSDGSESDDQDMDEEAMM